MAKRPQPGHVKWPFNEQTAEIIEKCFRTLFQDSFQEILVTPPFGGTGLTVYVVGDLLYADGVASIARLAGVATGNALISGGVGAAPSWGKIGLATHVSGTLPAANGGTGLSSYTIGDMLYADGVGSIARLAGVATGNALISGGVGAAPAWGKIALTTHVSGILPVANGGTNKGSWTAQSLVFVGAGGTALTEDNAKLFWNTTTEKLTVAITSGDKGFRTANTGAAADDYAGYEVANSTLRGTFFAATGANAAVPSAVGIYTDAANGIVLWPGAVLALRATSTAVTIPAGIALTLGTALTVASGGTGRASHTEYAVICGGTTTTAAQQSIAAVGSAGQVLTSNGAGALPTFQAAAGGGGTVDEAFVMALAGM